MVYTAEVGTVSVVEIEDTSQVGTGYVVKLRKYLQYTGYLSSYAISSSNGNKVEIGKVGTVYGC